MPGQDPGLRTTTLDLKALNSFLDAEATGQAGALAASDAAVRLGFYASDFSALAMKCLERKVEVLQWAMMEDVQQGSSKVHMNVSAKKDMFTVDAPVTPQEVCLPYAGNVALTNPNNKGRFLTSMFGVKFFVQPRTDALASDIVVPAWSARAVTKANDCYFNSSVVKRPYLILRQSKGHAVLEQLMHIELHLLAGQDAKKAVDAPDVSRAQLHLQELEEACVSEGGKSCAFPACV